MVELERYRGRLESLTTPHTYHHSLCVKREAVRLAALYGADVDRAALAGLLHDICKNMDKEALLQMLGNSAIILQKEELANPSIWHGIAAGNYLRSELGIEDEQVLSAVRYHTTGRAGMSLLEKVVYLADGISEDRQYPGVENMREAVNRSLDEGMALSLKHTIMMLAEAGKPIVPDTYYAYNYYCEELKCCNR